MHLRPRLFTVFALSSVVVSSTSLAQTNNLATSGNVGIGTMSPQQQLHISQAGAATMLIDQTPDGGVKYSISSRWGGYFTIWDETNPGLSGAPRIAINPSGGVGIGTLFPYGAFHVNVSSPYGAITNNNTIALRNSNTTAWNATSIINYDASNTWHANAAIDFLNHNHQGVTGAASIRFYTKKPDSPLAEAMQINSSGYVGIGTTTPVAKLDVVDTSGNAYARLFANNPGNGRTATLEIAAANGGDAGTASILKFSALVSQQHSKLNIQNAAGADLMTVLHAGNVGIGTTNPTHKLAVNGTIKAKEVIVETIGWSDYVFADDYILAPLAEVETHIKAHKHLPGIPSAVQVAAQGISVGDMQAKLLAKIEELTLHVIAQEKSVKSLQAQNELLQTQVQQLRAR